jgi:methylthioribose-1-phosphate isomerase
VRIIDQTQLPEKLIYLDIDNVPTLGEAIQNLRVRGAPAIGIAGAMGVALAAFSYLGEDPNVLVHSVREAILYMKTTRPTAVNLFWALDRMETILNTIAEDTIDQIRNILLQEALSILEEDREICRKLGRNGAELVPDDATVLTHCNAGGLATADYGTALGVIYAAVEMGKKIKVYADETRPLLQGSRLTAWELKESGIDVTVICDSAAGSLMRQGNIDCVIVGADRIAANGDAANKVGTYPLAVLAAKHEIPFYVAAPVSTFDFSLESGDAIPIEERSGEEVVNGFGVRTGPEGIDVYNPAFDVTPHELVSAFVTEKGVHHPPYGESLAAIR